MLIKFEIHSNVLLKATSMSFINSKLNLSLIRLLTLNFRSMMKLFNFCPVVSIKTSNYGL